MIQLRHAEGEMSVECIYYKGTLVRKKVSYTANRRGYHLIIDDVPAWVCQQCGEPLFDEETVDAIQEVLRGVDARVKGLAVLSTAVGTAV
jgi:YgiT-type zinc finger domain-containing protein